MLRILPIILLFGIAVVVVLMTSERSTQRTDTMMSAGPVALAAASEPAGVQVDEPIMVEGVTSGNAVAATPAVQDGSEAPMGVAEAATPAPKQDWVRIPGTPIGIWPKPTG